MEALEDEGKAVQQGLQYGQQIMLADALDGGDELELGHRVHRVDQVDPLDAVEVALMRAIDADEAG